MLTAWKLTVLDVSNCINLDQSWGKKIMDDVLLGIETMLPQLKHSPEHDQVFCKEVLVSYLDFAVCIVGDELPPRMKHKNNNGSSIFILMELVPLDFIVVVFSAVVVYTDDQGEIATQFPEFENSFDCLFGTGSHIKCQTCFLTESGCSLNECCSLVIFWGGYSKPKYSSISDNILVWCYTLHLKDKHKFSEASVQFFVESESGNLVVKKCRVHLLYSFDDQVPPLTVPSFGYSYHSTSFVSLS